MSESDSTQDATAIGVIDEVVDGLQETKTKLVGLANSTVDLAQSAVNKANAAIDAAIDEVQKLKG